MKINIPQPCTENWNNMQQGIKSRHCSACSKNVIDFTYQTHEEIYKTLLQHTTETVCGRFRSSQLDFSIPHEAIRIYPQQITPRKAPRIPILALSLAIALSTSCDAQTKPPKPSMVTDTVNTPISTSNGMAPVPTPIPEEQFTMGIPEPILTDELMGEVIAIPTAQDSSEEEMVTIAEVMPEFPGGDKALFQYITSNLDYPKWEYEQNIDGTIYVKFIIAKDGKAHSSEIIKPITGSKNFNAVVIDLVNNMPTWSPATIKSKPISMYYYLPIKFVIPQK